MDREYNDNSRPSSVVRSKQITAASELEVVPPVRI